MLKRPVGGLVISIHALREEGDYFLHAGIVWISNFYPRPPRGGRLGSPDFRVFTSLFLSTPSARRATCCPGHGCSMLSTFLSTPSARRAT